MCEGLGVTPSETAAPDPGGDPVVEPAEGSPSLVADEGEVRRAMDPWLFFAAMSLACLGLVMVYSASVYTARVRYHDWEYFLGRQSVLFALGTAVMVLTSRLDYRIFRR